MVRKRKSKPPITKSSLIKPSLDSAKPKSTRNVIRRFHVLLKRRANLQKKQTPGSSTQELQSIESELAALGGLEAYQNMSAIGQGKDRGGGSEAVLIRWLKELRLDGSRAKGKGKAKDSVDEGKKLQLLEVGALKPDNYASCASWISCTPIDLRSRHPDIREQDFLEFDVAANAGKLDVVSLSLVINFVPDAGDRGKMLRISHDILRPPDPGSHHGGLMFLVLPTPCVTNSRYMTAEHLVSLCSHIGFTLLYERCKPGGKVSYWLFARTDEANGSDKSFAKKVGLREGSDRNNFSILL